MRHLLAWSKDDDVRRYASSGGFTKELLRHALVSGFVDYLVFARMKGTGTEVVVTQDPAELMTPTSNSVYQTCPTLRGTKQVPTDATYAITVLPCQAEHLHDARAKLVVELLCNYVPSREWTEQVLRRLGAEDAVELIYRSGNWPGTTMATRPDGSVATEFFPKIWSNDLARFGPVGCQHCPRLTPRGHFVVGDPWGLEPVDQTTLGKTMVKVVDESKMSLVDAANIAYEEIPKDKWDRSTGAYQQKKKERVVSPRAGTAAGFVRRALFFPVKGILTKLGLRRPPDHDGPKNVPSP